MPANDYPTPPSYIRQSPCPFCGTDVSWDSSTCQSCGKSTKEKPPPPLSTGPRFGCAACDESVAQGAVICRYCGRDPRTGVAPAAPPEGDATGGIIPYKNSPALVGYYLGVFSLAPCIGIPLGIAAIICGVLGLKKRKREPHVKGSAHAVVGIVLGSISLLYHVAGLIALTQVK